MLVLTMDRLMKKLIKYKESCNITFDRLARELDIPETYIYRWKNDRPISRANKKLIEKFLSNRKL